MKDQNALAPTVLPTDSEGIVSFAKGERQREDTISYKDGVQKEREGRLKQSKIDKLNSFMPNYWGQYEGYMMDLTKDYQDKWSNTLAETDGNLSLQQKAEQDRDRARLSAMGERSLELKGYYEAAITKLEKDEYNTPENKEKLSYLKNPMAHATKHGKVAELEEKGPLLYAMENIIDGPILKSTWSISNYIKTNMQSDLDDLTTSIKNTWGDSEGATGGSTVQERSSKAVNEYLQNKYLTDTVFGDHLDEMAVERNMQPEELLAEVAKGYVIDKRTTETRFNAAQKDKTTTVRYISNKGGKRTVTKEFRDGVIVDFDVNLGKSVNVDGKDGIEEVTETVPFAKSTSDLGITIPAGKLRASNKANETITGSSDYVLGEGHLMITEKGNVVWKGTASEVGSLLKTKESVLLGYKAFDSPEIRQGAEALKLMWEESKGSSGGTTPQPGASNNWDDYLDTE